MTILRNAVEVLRCFSPQAPELTVTEVARRLGMAKSTSSRLLRSMADCSLLEHDATTRRFRIGPMMAEFGALYRAHVDVVDLAHREVAALSAETGHTGYVSQLDGADIVVLRIREGTRPLRVVTPPGWRMPAFATAIGRALLACLDDAEIRARHPDGLTPPSPTAPRGLDELMRRVAEVRRVGWATSHDEGLRGVGSVAVAVPGAQSEPPVGLCLAFAAAEVDEAEREAMGRRLLEAARRLGPRAGNGATHDAPEDRHGGG